MSYNESLNSNSNYPPMSQSEWDRAPWNQREQEEREFKVCISQTLSKSTTICTNDYAAEYEDETGNYRISTGDTQWKEALEDSETYTPLDLINEFKKFLERLIEERKSNGESSKRNHLYENSDNYYEHLIEECKNWTEDELEIIEE